MGTSEGNNWRVLVVEDSTTFLPDQLKLFVGRREDDATRMVKPLELEMREEGIPAGTTVLDDLTPTVWPRELCEVLFDALGHTLLGISDPYMEIRRLQRELSQANARVDSLIEGIRGIGAKKRED